MIRLNPPGILMSQAGVTATQNMLATHAKLVQHWDLLSNDDRAHQLTGATIKGLNLPVAEDLVFGIEFVLVMAENVPAAQWKSEMRRMTGFGSATFSSAIYAARELKNALIGTHAGCCAYCESYLRHVDHGDVEHFRPKAGVEEPQIVGLNRDAYFWLAYEPTNLFLACKICNEVHKGNQFPVFGARLPPGETDISKEQAVLIHPYAEDPRRFIRFNPMNGKAYPFDLLAAYLGDGAEEGIWKDPSVIDNPPNPQQYAQFLQNAAAELRRGIANISLYHLNRPALIRARVAHLRHLRALYWTAQLPDGIPDAKEAKRLCQGAIASASLAPEFLSLTIDALETWTRRAAANLEPRLAQQEVGAIDQKLETDPWILAYDTFLAAFEHPVADEFEVDPATYNDSISYYILPNELQVTDFRRLVYVTDQEKVYGLSEDDTAGIYLAVPWEDETELSRTVTITTHAKKGDTDVQIKLRDFLTIDPKVLYSRFRNKTVKAAGPFEPFGNPW